MNKLVLRGYFVTHGDEKFIQYETNNRKHLLPINAKETFEEGAFVCFTGSLHTYRIYDGAKRHKKWVARGVLSKAEEVFENSLVFTGTVVGVEKLRVTSLTKRKVVDFVVAFKKDYLNCVAFGGAAEAIVSGKKIGDPIVIENASFQSRDYLKNGEKKIAYEVCIRRFS